MEVMIPLSSSSPGFHFDGAEATPYNTAPSSPRLLGEPFDYQYHYTSAPTSPTRAAAIYSHFSSGWDNTPLSPRGGDAGNGDMFDFAFDSGRRSEISTADELFDKGRIRPMQPPSTPTAAPRSGERGRERISPAAHHGSRARDTRSLSPLRDQGFFNKNAAEAAAAPPAAYVKSGGGSKKWSLKDLLLFRSASEGRATERDPLRKYSLFSSFSPFSSSAATTSAASKKKGGDQDSMNGSFRSTEGGTGSVRRGGGAGSGAHAASAHKMHYTANRAAAEELRKKTPLAYQRQGLFSCMQFNPAIRSITKGFRGGD